MALIPRTAQGDGWLRPVIGVVELSQNIIQALPLSARKIAGGSSEGVAPFLQLPHFNEAMVKKITRKDASLLKFCVGFLLFFGLKIPCHYVAESMNVSRFVTWTLEVRVELPTQVAGLSTAETKDVELVLGMMPSLTIDFTWKTEGEEGIQEGDIVTMHAWITLKRASGLVAALPHVPSSSTRRRFFGYCLLNLSPIMFGSPRRKGRASLKETNAAVREDVESGSRLVMGKFQAPAETNLKIKILKRSQSRLRGSLSEEGAAMVEGIEEKEQDEDGYDDYESEYSKDEEDKKDSKRNGAVADGAVGHKRNGSSSESSDYE
ncbi:dnaJ protein ERDJ2A-like [Durio zibethinus]|uniref:DnaJ protein ERDJ2A-like n=1 Tax=Durio zibethinus TaxID=66656 RepID=A0A6P6ALS2_DURZI|nr:dnaJ protein ERDJ2A-like [Durio zibethinus]